MSLATIVVIGLATYRVVRLATRDVITDAPRAALFRWAWHVEATNDNGSHAVGEPRAAWRTWVYEGATCPVCLGVWVAGVMWLLWRYGGVVCNALIVVLAIAAVSVVVVRLDDTMSTDDETET